MSDKRAKSQEKKDQLLILAKSGVKRPSMTDPLAVALNNYCSASGHAYDEAFANEIKTLAASWFRARKPKTTEV